MLAGSYEDLLGLGVELRHSDVESELSNQCLTARPDTYSKTSMVNRHGEYRPAFFYM